MRGCEPRGAADAAVDAKDTARRPVFARGNPQFWARTVAVTSLLSLAVPGCHLAVLGALQIKYRFAAEDFVGQFARLSKLHIMPLRQFWEVPAEREIRSRSSADWGTLCSVPKEPRSGRGRRD